MRTKCFFGFHKWKLYNSGEGILWGNAWKRMSRPPLYKGTIYRKCECCGVIEW